MLSYFPVPLDKSNNASCATNNGGCQHMCTDLLGGGYLCHCHEGYTVSPTDAKSCEGR